MKHLKLILAFAFMALLNINPAWGADVYYEKCTAVSDIVNNGTYIVVVSDGTNYYAVQQNSTNYLTVALESDGTIKNPSASIVWTAATSGDGYTFSIASGSSTYYIYNSLSKGKTTTTVTTTGTTSSTWTISVLEENKKTFKVMTDRYLGWSGSKFAAYATTNFVNQFESGKSFGQYSGALYIYKVRAGSTKTTVKYDANEKSLSGGSTLPDDVTDATPGQVYTVSNATVSADGYDFVGWNTDKDANVGLTVIPAATMTAGATVTLYAIWKTHICTSTANITKASATNGSFVVSDESVCIEGGSGSVTITCTPNANYHVSNVTSTVGSANGSGNNWTVTDITADAEIYVVFTEDTYDTYIDNLQDGGEQKKYGSYTAPSLTDKTPATSGTCEQVHYHFVGWVGAENKANPTDSNIIKAAAERTATGATYYAVWAKEENE